jgi:hypothetical protein
MTAATIVLTSAVTRSELEISDEFSVTPWAVPYPSGTRNMIICIEVVGNSATEKCKTVSIPLGREHCFTTWRLTSQ